MFSDMVSDWRTTDISDRKKVILCLSKRYKIRIFYIHLFRNQYNTFMKSIITSIFVLLLAVSTSAQKPLPTEQISTIPHNLLIHNQPVDYKIKGNSISMTASRKTNLFNSPSGKPKVVNAPLILFEPEANFNISA